MQTENKWLNEINKVDDGAEQIDEYIQFIGMAARGVGQAVGRLAATGAKAARAGGKVAAKAGKKAAAGAKRVSKAAAKKAQNISKKIKRIKQKKDSVMKKVDHAKDLRDRLSKYKKEKRDMDTKVQQATKSPMKRVGNTLDTLGKMAGSAFKDIGKDFDSSYGGKEFDDETTDESLNNFRMEVRKRLVREIMEAEPAGDDGGDGKKGMDPEMAKEIMKSLEGKTVKAKSGKEIKVSSALNPNYKKTDPRAHKKATDMFKKAAHDFFSKQSRKKQGGKVPKSPEDLKSKKQTNTKQSVDTTDQKPDVTKKPKVKTTEPKNPKDMNSGELQQNFVEKTTVLTKANELFDKAINLAKKDPNNPKAQQAVQQAADERFVAQVGQSQAAMDIIDNHKAKEDVIKKEHPNPLSKERRQKLKAIKEEKKKAFEATGLTTASIIHTMNQKDIQDRWDNSIAGEGSEELTQVVDGKDVEVGATRVNPETGDVDIICYEVDENGEQVKDEDGNVEEIVVNEDEMESKTDVEAALEKENERKEAWKDWFTDQFDFSDNFDIADELDLEFGSSSYVSG